MGELKIYTNNHDRQFVYRHDVPEKVIEEDFDHLEDESDMFFYYRGIWYHVSDFMTTDKWGPLKDWDGYSQDSFFSGVVIKLDDDCETFRVGTYIS